ncbi:hypothetical protein GLI01_20000 [Gluconacetobacter liquefaciens]|nr:hypothetical protein AA0522_0137 [Gluconacetobacter liquefaciens NRIC 0522]GEB37965.1 hypothetical protein GLI01_20000 [Gluconacetobacter liquefaciens]
MLLSEPGGVAQPFGLGGHGVTDLAAEGGLVEQRLEMGARGVVQGRPGILGVFPAFGIDLVPERIGRVVPTPAQIQCEAV